MPSFCWGSTVLVEAWDFFAGLEVADSGEMKSNKQPPNPCTINPQCNGFLQWIATGKRTSYQFDQSWAIKTRSAIFPGRPHRQGRPILSGLQDAYADLLANMNLLSEVSLKRRPVEDGALNLPSRQKGYIIFEKNSRGGFQCRNAALDFWDSFRIAIRFDVDAHGDMANLMQSRICSASFVETWPGNWTKPAGKLLDCMVVTVYHPVLDLRRMPENWSKIVYTLCQNEDMVLRHLFWHWLLQFVLTLTQAYIPTCSLTIILALSLASRKICSGAFLTCLVISWHLLQPSVDIATYILKSCLVYTLTWIILMTYILPIVPSYILMFLLFSDFDVFNAKESDIGSGISPDFLYEVYSLSAPPSCILSETKCRILFWHLLACVLIFCLRQFVLTYILNSFRV